MTYLSENYIEEKLKIIKHTTTPNWKVKDYKNPPKKDIQRDSKGDLMYRSKKIQGNDGREHMIKFAIMKKAGHFGGRTKITSKWERKT